MRQRLEPRVAVLTDETAAPFADVPVPPARFRVVSRVQPRPRAPRQADNPGDTNTPPESDQFGRCLWRFRYVTDCPTGVVISVQVATVEHVTSPSRWFLRTGGVWLGRCGSTGPAVFTGITASFGRGARARAEWKRTQCMGSDGMASYQIAGSYDSPSGHRSTPLSAGRFEDAFCGLISWCIWPMQLASAKIKCHTHVPSGNRSHDPYLRFLRACTRNPFR